MAKFNKRPHAADRRKPGLEEEQKETSKKNDYKAKRSFTRNKSLRGKEGPKTGGPYKRKEYGAPDRMFKEKSTTKRTEHVSRSSKSYGDNEEREPTRGAKRTGANKSGVGFRANNSKPFKSYGDNEEREPTRGAKRVGAGKSGVGFRTNNSKPFKSYGDNEEREPTRGAKRTGANKSGVGFRANNSKPFKSYGDNEEREPTRGAKRTGANKSGVGFRANNSKPFKSYGDNEEREPTRGAKRTGANKSGVGFRANNSKPFKSYGDNEEREPTRGAKRTGADNSKPFKSYGDNEEREPARGAKRAGADSTFNTSRRTKREDFENGKNFSDERRTTRKAAPQAKKASDDSGLTRLNKYLSNAGISSRREADVLIQSGAVKVNGEVVNQLGYKIKSGDKVTYGDAAVKSERKIYLLLNKPKDYITTVDDPQERKTVMELIQGACRERVYPVGRLDRNTTGLLLFTNDGELTKKLTHPKFGIKKVYHVSLNKGLKPEDFKSIVEGVELEDGMINADDLAFVGEGKKEIGIEIHSGRNRLVRRLFEHLGYDVLKLDRVTFAGLTKKDLPRGKYRFLTSKEVSFLQMIG